MSVRDFQQRRMADICDKPKPQIVDDPCVICGTREMVVILPGGKIAACYPCHAVIDGMVDNIVKRLEGGAA